jgi:hypothetical protein
MASWPDANKSDTSLAETRPRLHRPTVGQSEPPITPVAAHVELLKWHLERYDRLRASTASRASVVLSAGAILSAGNALAIGQLLGGSFDQFGRWLTMAFGVAALGNAILLVLSLIRATNVLVTRRASRAIFDNGPSLPPSLLFNGTDTVTHTPTFEAFRAVVAEQTERDILAAAQVELWVGIQQHRRRYAHLRASVRLLQYAAVTFLVILAGAMFARLLLSG